MALLSRLSPSNSKSSPIHAGLVLTGVLGVEVGVLSERGEGELEGGESALQGCHFAVIC